MSGSGSTFVSKIYFLLVIAATFFVHTLAGSTPSYCHTQVEQSDPLFPTTLEKFCQTYTNQTTCATQSKHSAKCVWESPTIFCYSSVNTSDPLYPVAELACESLSGLGELGCVASEKTAEACEYGPGPEFCHTQVNLLGILYPAASTLCGALLSGSACSAQSGISNCTWDTPVSDRTTVETWGALASAVLLLPSQHFKIVSFTLSAGFSMAGYTGTGTAITIPKGFSVSITASAGGAVVLDAGLKGNLFVANGILALTGLTLTNGVKAV
jgi:hypothetical protein